MIWINKGRIIILLPLFLVISTVHPEGIPSKYFETSFMDAYDSTVVEIRRSNDCNQIVSKLNNSCDKGNSDACLELAKFYYSKGIYLRAKRILSDMNKNSPEVNYWLGQVNLILDKPDSAISYFYKARKNKYKKIALLGIGDVYYKKEEKNVAKQWYTEAGINLNNPAIPTEKEEAESQETKKDLSQTSIKSEADDKNKNNTTNDEKSEEQEKSKINNQKSKEKEDTREQQWKKGNWTIQFGAFRDKKSAQKLLKKVETELLTARIYEVQVGMGSNFYLVWGGIFKTEEKAKQRAKNLSDEFAYTIEKIKE